MQKGLNRDIMQIDWKSAESADRPALDLEVR